MRSSTGLQGGLASPSLLVIAAGAGSGKTNTLAHLIVQRADPRRHMLMTFLAVMTKRVERIARKVLGNNAGIMTEDALYPRKAAGSV